MNMVKTKIIVRLATRKDRHGIKEINEQCLPVTYDEHSWETIISQRSTFVAVTSGLIIGYVAGNNDGCIVSFAVSAKYRGAGFGKKLIHAVINHMKTMKLNEIILRVKVSNQIAQKLYLSVGFKPVEKLTKYYDTEDGYLMKLNLKNQSD
jgi:[ribosomal protein S18]-alanine N-acetyltransferase